MRQPFLVRIEGARQGAFPGESDRPGAEGGIDGLSWHYEVEAPERGGRPEHGVVSVTKALGAASPALFQALITGETLSRVTIDFLRSTSEGVIESFHRVVLTDARVERIEQYSAEPEDLRFGELEEVDFSFGSITVEQPGGALASDTLAPRVGSGLRPSPRRNRDR